MVGLDSNLKLRGCEVTKIQMNINFCLYWGTFPIWNEEIIGYKSAEGSKANFQCVSVKTAYLLCLKCTFWYKNVSSTSNVCWSRETFYRKLVQTSPGGSYKMTLSHLSNFEVFNWIFLFEANLMVTWASHVIAGQNIDVNPSFYQL